MRTEVNCDCFIFFALYDFSFFFRFVHNKPLRKEALCDTYLSMPKPMQCYSALIMCKMH